MRQQKNIRELPERLFLCNTEEEVKYAFAKAFDIKLDTFNRIDMYTEEILYEFKHNKDFNNIEQRSRAIAQALYYVYKLKNTDDTRSIPPVICCVDKNGAFFIKKDTYARIVNNEKYDWDRAPSTPDPVMIKAVAKIEETKTTHIYNFSIPEDYLNFVKKWEEYNVIQLTLTDNSLKKVINESSFHSVFSLWRNLFGDYVQNSTKPSEYFLADIREGGSYVLTEGQVAFEFDMSNLRRKSIPMKDYEYFWNTYEKCKDPRTVISIRQKIDRLTKEDLRRRTGEFYTPIEFARVAVKYIEKAAGAKWWERGYRLWDMAAGSGNLEYELPEDSLPYCYMSTLLDDDVNYLGQIYPRSTVFQYDYLNDDVKMLFEKKIDLENAGVFAKMPDALVRDLKNPDIKWIIFINPPYATANRTLGTSQVDKKEVSFTEVRRLMTDEGLGEASRELMAQFLWRISKEFAERAAYLGIFSKLGYINANNDQKLRDTFFKYKFIKGFCFPASAFHGCTGQFPVGFIVWDLSVQKELEKQKIKLDVFSVNTEKIGSKIIKTGNRGTFLSKWVPRYRNTDIMPPLSSAINVAKKHIDVRDRIAPGFLASFMTLGNDFQHQNNTALLSAPFVSAGAFSVTQDNFERVMVVHTVRRLPKATWLNDRDQFLAPKSDDLSAEFITDCAVWSLFSNSNQTASLQNITYKGKTYDIINHLYPFPLSKVITWHCPLIHIQNSISAAREDRFAAKWLKNRKLSKQAQAVLSCAEVIYKGFYAHLPELPYPRYKIACWDAGFYQIRMALKEAGLLTEETALLNEAHKDLGAKILPDLYEYGFLQAKEYLFEDEE